MNHASEKVEPGPGTPIDGYPIAIAPTLQALARAVDAAATDR